MTDFLVVSGDMSWYMEADDAVPRVGEEIVIAVTEKGRTRVVRAVVKAVKWNGTELPHGRYSLKAWVYVKAKP